METRLKKKTEGNMKPPTNTCNQEQDNVGKRKRKTEGDGGTSRKRRKRQAEDQEEVSGNRRCNGAEEIITISSTPEIIAISSTPEIITIPSHEEDIDVQQNHANERDNNRDLVSQNRSSLTEEEIIYEMASLGNLGSRDDFKSKYKQLRRIGAGGFGCVYNGHRKSDLHPVAIKHVKKPKVMCQAVTLNGKFYNIILEVAFMLKSSGLPGSRKESGTVSLMDFYNLENELILVMENPQGCKNLLDYCNDHPGGPAVEETIATLILKQLVDAAVHMHNQAIFHRDIKLQNVLIQEINGVPKVWIIDFGCSDYCKTDAYTSYMGTVAYAPPEYRSKKRYWSRPTTVWQLGIIYFEMLFGERHNKRRYARKLRESSLSAYSKLVLNQCLMADPDHRATLDGLQRFLNHC